MFRSVKHDLLGLKGAATLRVAGPADAEHLVYLQAGFPCDHSSLEPLAARLASECGCLVGVGCLPEYDRDVPLRPEGYDMEQLLACFSQAVDALKAQSSRAPSAKLTLIVHDWGCAPGFMYSNTAGCDKLVAFDVLMAKKPDRLYYALNHLNYQGHFAIAFKLSQFSGVLGRMYLSVFSFLSFGVLRRWLNPVGPKDTGTANPFAAVGGYPWQAPLKDMAGSVATSPFRCYPYFYMLRSLALGHGSILKKLSFDSSVAKQPICFIFGEEKNTHFHAQAQLEKLRATPGCRVHAVKDAGHWCYKHAPDVCFEAVRAFILGD